MTNVFPLIPTFAEAITISTGSLFGCLIFPALFIPFLVMARIFHIWPTGRAVLFLSAPVIFAGLFFIWNASDVFWTVLILDFALLLFTAIDFCLLLRCGSFVVQRKTERVASLSKPHRITLRVENRSGRRQWIRMADDLIPGLFESETLIVPRIRSNHSVDMELDESKRSEKGPFEDRYLLPANEAMEWDYEFRPATRGAFRLNFIYLSLFGALGLWQRELKLPCETEIDVYPDLEQIKEYEILVKKERLHHLGVRPVRRIGIDDDFERLRDYTPDDQYKFMDWRATARRRRLIVKDFQMTRSQRIVFLIDSGRMMMNRIEGISLLDHAFNAMLMLSYIALRQGDEVGFLCFNDHIRRYIPPCAGLSHINRLTNGCFNLFPEQVESRYDLAFGEFSHRCRKRSMAVLITNINDERNANRLESHLTQLVGRHLPLGVLLREHSLFDAVAPFEPNGVDSKPSDDRSFFRAGAAAEILNTRRHVLAQLNAKGTLTLDVFPEDLTAPLINRYLEIKARHLL